MPFRTVFLLLVGSSLLTAAPARPDSGKVALVIVNGSLEENTTNRCRGLGENLVRALKADAFDVEAVVDGSMAMIQSSILQFARQLRGDQKTAVAYVCSQVATREGRLFLVPAHVGLDSFDRPQTQGLLVRAVMNVLPGTNGVLLGDLFTTDVVEARAVDGWTSTRGIQMAVTLGRDYTGDIGVSLIAYLAQPTSKRTPFSKFLSEVKESRRETNSVFELAEEDQAPPLPGPRMPSANAGIPLPNKRPVEIEPRSTSKAKPPRGRKTRAKSPGVKKEQSDRPLFFGLFGNERRNKR